MERAGADDLPEDAERQGLGTPATRASILEKLVQMGFVERRGKQLLPTKDGHNLACVLPEALTSPQLTAQWETELTAIAKGQADPEGFMAGMPYASTTGWTPPITPLAMWSVGVPART